MTTAEKEYIERGQVLEITNRLSNEPYYQHNGETFYAGVSAVDLEILTIPTADVAEVKHGTWEEHDRYVCNSDGKPVVKIGVVFTCSECGRQEYQKEPYCHCGAKMDGDSNIESGAKVMLRLCGNQYKYCNGDCKHCNEPEYHATNKLTEVKENKDAE